MKKYIIFDLDGTLIESMYQSDSIIIWTIRKYYPEIDEKKIISILQSCTGTPLIIELEMIFEWKKVYLQELTDEIYEEIFKLDCQYYPGVISIVKQLSQTYILFLTTWNATKTAMKHLNAWWIQDYFSLVLWSDTLLKWIHHLEKFAGYTWDKFFYQNALYVWDGNSDREFAKMKDIDFIHVGHDRKDLYEIPSVREIGTILSLF